MIAAPQVSRRLFLASAGAVGGGLSLGLRLPFSGAARHARRHPFSTGLSAHFGDSADQYIVSGESEVKLHAEVFDPRQAEPSNQVQTV